jgi:hypothetical protein
MLDKVKDLRKFRLRALDGWIGSVSEFYFDDQFWTIRYLVAETGSWLEDRAVLISPYAVTSVNRNENIVSIDLTRRQIESGPTLASHNPVSRRFEESCFAHFGWPSYRDGPFAWGSFLLADQALKHRNRSRKNESGEDRALQSTRDVMGHRIEAEDGEIGHVEDFVFEDRSWTIRYMIVAMRNWWPGSQVLISPLWIGSIDWMGAKVNVNLSRDAIRTSPVYAEDSLLVRDYETRLHDHYDREGYWNDEMAGAGLMARTAPGVSTHGAPQAIRLAGSS